MKIKDLLQDANRSFHTITPDQTVEEALKRMSGYGVSALLVMEKDVFKGIFTERDLVRCHILFPDQKVAGIPVSDVMTSRLFTAVPDDTVDAAMAMMIKANIRHLPVVADGRIQGMVDLTDLVKTHVDALSQELHLLKDYISDLQDAAHD